MAKSKVSQYTFEFDGVIVPIKVTSEFRSSIRYSIGRKSVNIRLPLITSMLVKEKQLLLAKSWLEKQFDKNPSLIERFKVKRYTSGDKMEVGDYTYQLHIEEEQRAGGSAKFQNGIISLKLPKNLGAQRPKMIQKLLSRIVSQHQLPVIKRRVYEINQLYFQEKIKAVKIKYNHSNWGSCSSTGNINLSSRLLFAPQEVQDYVVIHELAHLRELNHSSKFWKIVRDIMPDYKEKEQWLKQFGNTCDF